MMKKAAGLALALMMALPLSAGAADFANRLGASYSDVSVRGTVLKGGRLVDFGREVWGHGMTVEVQHGQGEETWYLHIQDLSRERGKNFFHDVTLARKEMKWNISPLPENPDTTFPASYTGMDLWYPLPKDLVDAMSAFPKDWKLTARKEDGNNFGHDFKNLAGKVSLMDKEPGALPNYGPAYSVYFPGEGPEEVQQAFLYHLNDRDEKGNPISYDGYYRYYQREEPYAAEFIYDYYGSTYNGYVSFYPENGGTWVDLDFWQNHVYRNSTGFGGYYYSSTVLTGVKDEFVNQGYRAVEEAYYDLENHPDYGIELEGGFNKSHPKVKSVDTAAHPELSAVQKGDWILSINGADVSSMNYLARYALDYAAPGSVLHITLKNDKTGEYTVDAKAVMKERRRPDGSSYKEQLEKDGLRSKGTPAQLAPWVPYHETFAPWDGEGHVMAPEFRGLVT